MGNETRKERHRVKMDQLEADRKALFATHKMYLEIVYNFGGGILLKPQLEQYITTFLGCSVSKVNKDLKKLRDLKLLKLEPTKAVSILVITKPGLMLLKNKKCQQEVSLSGVWTENNFKKSVIKNEFIIAYAIRREGCQDYSQLVDLWGKTNVINREGDNAHIARVILDDVTGTSNELSALRDYNYIKGVLANKRANLKNNDANKMIVPGRDKYFVSINHLQARHIYIISYPRHFEFVYMEITKKINYQKFKSDMHVLSLYLQNLAVDFLTIQIVVPINRKKTIQKVVSEWTKKQRGGFVMAKGRLKIKLSYLDIDDKYFKGATINIL